MERKKHTPYRFQEGQEKDVLVRLERYCAYTERCEFDVIRKLKSWQVPESYFDEAIQYLKDQNYIREERYGEQFARGKFRLKSWGRQKIRAKLREKNVDDNIIESSLEEIDEQEYINRLNQLMEARYSRIKEEDNYTARAKLYQYAFQKGYESSLIIKWLDHHL
ncbi:MAG TPA: regulatory protein RecX [Chitinophagales bacterium]|nr:regulatory protein RecX [Chitinophagales bacterium]